MKWRRLVMVSLCMAVVVGTAMLSPRLKAAAGDAVADAKRKAAAQLLREGKAIEAISLTQEVIAGDDTNYADHLLLARAYEKLGQNSDTMREYKRILELVPGASSKTEERLARSEADKKLKQLDPMASKLDAFADDYLKKLDALEKEAVSLRSMPALERIFRLRGSLWRAEHREDKGYAEVFAKGEWQACGLDVKEKQSYRVRAAGTWRVRRSTDNTPVTLVECSANGISNTPTKRGALMGNINGKYIELGEDTVFVAPASGPLLFIENDQGANFRLQNTGSLQVLVEARN